MSPEDSSMIAIDMGFLSLYYAWASEVGGGGGQQALSPTPSIS